MFVNPTNEHHPPADLGSVPGKKYFLTQAELGNSSVISTILTGQSIITTQLVQLICILDQILDHNETKVLVIHGLGRLKFHNIFDMLCPSQSSMSWLGQCTTVGYTVLCPSAIWKHPGQSFMVRPKSHIFRYALS